VYQRSRTLHGTTTSVQNVRVDHRRGNVFVAEQLLNRPDVGAIVEKVRGEGMAQRMRRRVLRDARVSQRVAERTLYHFGAEVMTAQNAASWIF